MYPPSSKSNSKCHASWGTKDSPACTSWLPSRPSARYFIRMGANTGSKRLLWAAMAAAALLAVLLLVFARGEPPAAPAPASAPPAAPPGPRPAIAEPTGAATSNGTSDIPSDLAPGEEAGNEHPVDLTRLREKIPDNLYWRLDAPTQDGQLLQARAEEKQRWNVLFGKVQSGTATDEEVQQYYAHRRQLSEDYIEFAQLVLAEHGAQLPEQERGMYELGIRMHGTRLGEIPRQLEQARERKALQDRRREEWRSKQ
jgi:hypothetical protein